MTADLRKHMGSDLFQAHYLDSVASVTFRINKTHDPESVEHELTDLLLQLRQHGVTEIAYFCDHEEAGYISDTLQRVILASHKHAGFSDDPVIFHDDGTGIIQSIPGVNNVDIRWWLFYCHKVYADVKVNWKDHDTIVYLPGKPHKVERSLVLKELLNSIVADHLMYSFRPQIVYDPDHPGFMTDWMDDCTSVSAKFFKYTGTGWVGWSKRVAREIDLSDQDNMAAWTATGREDHRVHHHALRVVTETWSGTPCFLTEKTFTPLVTGVPFLCWDIRNSEFLESMGFQSFDRVISPELIYHDNPLMAAQALVHRTQEFWKMRSDPEFQNKVDAIITHNHAQIQKYLASVKHYDKFFSLIPGR